MKCPEEMKERDKLPLVLEESGVATLAAFAVMNLVDSEIEMEPDAALEHLQAATRYLTQLFGTYGVEATITLKREL
jgi:hypothetical protein